jgi:alkaline phosphatase
VILVVSDGMSASVPGLTEDFSRLVRNGRSTRLAELADRSETTQGLLVTASLSSPVTDSAAASSAWASGSKVANGSINQLPDGTRLVPIGPLARDAGRRVGLVTTTRITHATPAAFAASVPSRTLEDQIAEQLLGIDVLMGGGRRHFDGVTRSDQLDLLARFRENGYSIATEASGLGQPGEGSFLGLFSDSHLPMTIDRRADPALAASVPTLAAMTESALQRLTVDDRGFLLQVEGGRVDHAAHANDAAGLLWDQLELDDALGVALDFAASRGDTLVVFLSDHGNSNPGLSGTGPGYRRSAEAFAALMQVTRSFEWMLPRLAAIERGGGGDEAIAAFILEHTGSPSDPRRLAPLRQALRGEPVDEANPQLANPQGQLGRLLSGRFGIGWVGTSHTADWVTCLATGPGCEALEGMHAHPELYAILADAMGVTHRNPTA